MQDSGVQAVRDEVSDDTGLRRQIGLFGLTMIAAGSCIGSGIFITPSDVAHQLGNTPAILCVWFLGGIVAITGSLTFAELAGRFPHSGGVYVFIRESYGRLWAFLYGWCILTVITSGAIAALSLTLARYISALVPLSSGGQIVVGISAITAVTVLNITGVKSGALFSAASTVCKLAGIAGIVLAGIFLGSTISDSASVAGVSHTHASVLGGFALAMIGVLWSYGGWHHASYVAAETKTASRIVPVAMIIGASIVTVTYLLSNWAYLRLLPLETLASSQAVAADALNSVMHGGAFMIAVLIAIATFGSIGIYTLTAPRIYHRMASDGTFFNKLAILHPRYRTPVWAIGVQSGWAIILLLMWSTFENLITYVVFMDWVFMILAALSIFYFRKKEGNSDAAGFRTPWYPLTPCIFIGISIWFIVYTLIGKPVQAIAGIGLLIIGLPVYLISRKKIVIAAE